MKEHLSSMILRVKKDLRNARLHGDILLSTRMDTAQHHEEKRRIYLIPLHGSLEDDARIICMICMGIVVSWCVMACRLAYYRVANVQGLLHSWRRIDFETKEGRPELM